MATDKLRQRRKELGLTLEEVAQMVGVGKSTVRKWESGEIYEMGRTNIANLAKALRVSPLFILGEDDDEPETQSYYTNSETQKIAEKIYQDKNLRLLFDAAEDADPDDLQLVHNMLKHLKEKELGHDVE